MSKRPNPVRLCAFPLAASFLVAATGPAHAHVTISPGEGTAGSYTVLTLSVPHGCEGSPTTRIAIEIPEPILSVTPTRNPLWQVRKVITKLDEPLTDTHGNEVTERVSQVVYTAKTPLPEGYRDAFELSLQLPDTPGETLVFPVVQTCERGEAAWVQLPSDGQDADELDAPAPAVVVMPADAAPAADEVVQSAAELEPTATEPAATHPSQSGSRAPGIGGLIAGLLGLGAGTTALVRTRRQS